MQSAIYLSTQLAQDSLGVQQKGAVGLMWTNGWKLGDMKLRFQAIEMCAPCLPIRFSALHCCIPPSSAVSRFVSAMYMLTIGTEHRKRLRVHSGKFFYLDRLMIPFSMHGLNFLCLNLSGVNIF